jgi:hypothetical protein
VIVFFLTICEVQCGKKLLFYRRFSKWQSVRYADIAQCKVDWVFGFIKQRGRFLFPWGRIYFLLPGPDLPGGGRGSGWDKHIVAYIRARAGLPVE